MSKDLDLREAIPVYRSACNKVLADRKAVAAAESAAAEHGDELLQYPLPPSTAPSFSRLMLCETVDVLLRLARRRGERFEPITLSEEELASTDVQALLRLAEKAHAAGIQAVIDRFGDHHRRVIGKREFRNDQNERLAAWARRVARKAGLKQDRVFELVGIPRRRAYRAAERAAKVVSRRK